MGKGGGGIRLGFIGSPVGGAGGGRGDQVLHLALLVIWPPAPAGWPGAHLNRAS